jgi:hypothetical protein
MPDHVVRFPQGTRHGWYLGRDEVVGLLPGRERDWPDLWQRYSEQSGQALADLRFADEDERAEFLRDLRL